MILSCSLSIDNDVENIPYLAISNLLLKLGITEKAKIIMTNYDGGITIVWDEDV